MGGAENTSVEVGAERQVSIEANISRSMSVADYQNGLTLIHELAISNISGPNLGVIDIELTADPPIFLDKTWRIDSLSSGSSHQIKPEDLQIDPRVLTGLTEREVALVEITARTVNDEEIVAKVIEEIDLLPRNHWGGLGGSLPEIIAAFSLPNDPSIDKLLSQAANILRESNRPHSLNGYTESPGRAWEVVNAIWNTVASQNFSYIYPPSSFEESGQKIRIPDTLVQSRMGTCLDLTMLFVALMEQSSLNPVIVFTKGHAFPGFWATQKTLPSSTTDDSSQIRNSLNLHELILFESTLVTSGHLTSFSEAIRYGARNVGLDRSPEFIMAVDIKQARSSGIRPLASLTATAESTSDAETKPVSLELESVPEEILAEPISVEEAPATTPKGRLLHWQKKLLDLTLRNRLLNFKAGKKSHQIEIVSASSIVELLLQGVKLKFAPTAGMSRLRNSSAQARLDALETEESIREQVEAALQKKTLLVKKSREDIDAALTQLFRDARLAMEEGGSNTLFLSIGYLRWQRPSETQRSFLAPLILFPVTIDRTSARSGFTIKMHDDGPRFNPTLKQMLEQDFNLKLPISDQDLPEDGNNVNIDLHWQKIRQSVRSFRGWEVVERVDLATFSFSKYLMWKDLVDRTDSLRRNMVVNQLLEGNKDGFPDQGDFPDESSLDTTYPPEEVFTPLPADSSQLGTVLAASKGKSFVVIGPPGTGKSQTIANLIAQTLGEGKTVLFVSEKIAALDVVHRRLREVGLGDYCLELHSNKANKRGVLDQLDSAWRRSGDHAQREEWREKTRELLRLRKDLNTYVAELHKTHENELSLFNAIGTISAGKELPNVELKHMPHVSDTQELYQQQESAAGMLQQSFETLPNEALLNSALPLVAAETWSFDFQERAELTVRDLHSQISRASQHLSTFQELLSAPERDWTPKEITAAVDFAGVITGIPDIPLSEAAQVNVRQSLDRIQEAAHRAISISNYERVLESWWDPPQVEAETGTRLAELLKMVSRLSVQYTSSADALNLHSLAADWESANRKFFLFRGRAKATVQQQLADAAKGTVLPDVKNDLPLLQSISEARSDIQADLQSMRAQLEPFLDLSSKAPNLWRGTETDLELVSWVRAFAGSLDAFIKAQPSGSGEAIRSALAALLGDVGSKRRELTELAESIMKDVSSLSAHKERFFECVFSPEEEQAKFNDGSLGQQAELCDDFQRGSTHLRTWCSWQAARKEADKNGLGPLLEALKSRTITTDQVLQAFQVNYARRWARSVVDRSPAIRDFIVTMHERKISDFRNTDEAYTELAAKIVELKIRAITPDFWQGGRTSQEGILRREIEKKRRHKPIRTLLSEIPNLITRIAPCFMMSPLSIAQYLTPDADLFDVVVFDEASQIPVWDAVGAIARGKQVIMVGDTKQLPPTSFFNRADTDDLEDEIEEDLPSILDECVASNMPRRELNWHYRSRHESLIAFSNRKYYKGNLVTFPAPVTADTAVSSRLVNGIYERGESRRNPEEARILVQEVIEHLTNHPDQTVGVITFNLQQKDLIEGLLDKERQKHDYLEQFFSADRIEPVMVKNLENVQGDERDAIFFSTTFGHDSAGKLYMNFGPLGGTGGERRLNVAVTRARRKLRVITSIRPEDIDLSRTRSLGVRDFRLFLDYANRGVLALDAEAQAFGGEADSPFEDSVATALRKLGWEVHQQIGVSGYRIDLAVVDPDAPGNYLAGIECDGATYHRTATARDRDQVRESVLRGLGWDILRIWSTDWFYGEDQVLNRIHSDLARFHEEQKARRLIEDSESAPSQTMPAQATAEGETLVTQVDNETDESDLKPLQQLVAHQVSTIPPSNPNNERSATPHAELSSDEGPLFRFAQIDEFDKKVSAQRFYETGYTPALTAMITHVIDTEGPIRDTDLVNTVRSWHGWNRTGARIRQRVLNTIPAQHAKTTEDDDTVFYWPAGSKPAIRIQFRAADGDDNQRSVPQIALPELVDLAHQCAQQPGNRETTVRRMCDALGIERLSASVRERLELAVKRARSSQP